MSTETLSKQVGKRHSFFQLFQKENYNIQIPIIQRDYAQGRKSKSEVRDLFLKALYDYLEDGIPNRDLDFVYGSTVQNETKTFIPLDGQQRLTTLFLLHWYLANISNNMEILKGFLFENKKSKFSYLTRTSSSEFCDALFDNVIDINKLLVDKETNKESLSNSIKDSCWYFLSWSKDPTIQAMLNMLDSIHEKFFNRPDFFPKLIDTSNPIITFLYLDLNEFGLTEDLYIKMNSRGKPLTTFENFKAKLEQHIKLNNGGEKFFLEFNGKPKQVTTQEYFSFNIDTKWANLFWHYRSLGGSKTTFDDELMNFIHVIAANQCAIERDFEKELFQYLNKTETVESEIPEYISYNKLNTLGVLTNGFIDYLIYALDNLSNGDNKIKQHLDNVFYFDEEEMFKKALTNKLTRSAAIQFHAYMRFLRINQSDRSGIFQWMRVVHNLSENTAIYTSEDVVKAIKSLESIMPFSNDILKYLINENSKLDFFYSRQVQEERIKAHLINKDDNGIFKSVIEKFECNTFFAGQLGFILEFSGILEYFEEHHNCNWNSETNEKFINQFVFYAEKAAVVFDILQTPKNDDFIVERSVLTKGNYLVPGGYDRFNFLSTIKDQRDYSWKRLLRIPASGDSESSRFKERRGFVKALLDDVRCDTSNIEKSLNNICKDGAPDWRNFFISQPDFIRYCQRGFIEWISEKQIFLVSQFRDNSRKRELYSYNLFNNLPDECEPFEYSFHAEINRDNQFSNVKFSNWCFNRKYYSMNVYFEEDDNNGESYFQIMFYKAKGATQFDDYATEVIDVLTSNGFIWEETDTVFNIYKKDESTTIAFLKNMLSKFNNL